MGVRDATAAVLLVTALVACGSTDPDVDNRDAPTPDVLDVTCTPGTGIAVGSSTVRTQRDGVHFRVVDRSGRAGTRLFAGRDVDHLLGNEGVAELDLWLLKVEPGELPLSCAPGAAGPTDHPVVVRVVDPAGNWSPVEPPQDMGCTPDGGSGYALPPATARTEAEALDTLVATHYAGPTRTYELRPLVGGYAGDPVRRFVLLLDGTPAETVTVQQQDDGTWAANDALTCAERLDEPVDRPPFPTQDADGPPTTLHVACAPERATVAAPQVRTSGDGVRLAVDNHTGWDGAFFMSGPTPEQVGGDRVDYPSLSPLTTAAPGRLLVGCAPTYSRRPDPATLARVTVVDPDHNWQPPRLYTDCYPTGNFYADGQGEGRTEQEALTDLLDHAPDWRTARIRLYDDGYWRVPGHVFLVRHRNHGEYTYGAVLPQPDGTWKTWMTGTCDPDRAGLLSAGD